MNWQEITGNWVFLPRRPRGIIHFLGGAFVAAAPNITYRWLLESLGNSGYAIVASCNTPNQCGDAHKSQHLPLTPLMTECETELRFKISGRVEGLSDRAADTIRVLNLGDHESHCSAQPASSSLCISSSPHHARFGKEIVDRSIPIGQNKSC